MTSLRRWRARAEIRRRHAAAFQLVDDAVRLATSALGRNQSKLRTDPGSGAPEAVAAFFAKGWKTIRAVRLLAVDGYGEDAMILLRSLTNVAIDMAFICSDNTEERLMRWVASARVARRRLAEHLGMPLPDEEGTDWNAVEAEANQWSGGGIRQRAEAAGVEHLYMFMYRFGSGFEHPDAWMLSDYVSVRDGRITMEKTEPSPQYVGNALTGAAICLGAMVGCLAQFFAFDHVEELERFQQLLSEQA